MIHEMEIEDMNGNGTTTGTADSGGNGNGRTGRKLNSAAVAKLRQSKFRSDNFFVVYHYSHDR